MRRHSPLRLPPSRGKLVQRTQRLLEKMHSPRLHMTLIILLTAAVGFFSSAVLLHFGMVAMWQRYPVAVLLAYIAFIFFLWCWLRGNLDIPNFSSDSRGSSCEASPGVDTNVGDLPGLGDAISGEELILVLVAVILLLAALLAAIWMVWIAPGLFAEILVDAALARGLYRRLPNVPNQHWLQTAWNRTYLPFLLAALLLSLTGAVIQHFYPAATSIGQALGNL